MMATEQGVQHTTGLQQGNPAVVGRYSILKRLFTLYRKLKKQERYLKNYLPVLLAEVAPGHLQAFTPALIKRTTKYWQLSLNVICENLYQLTGKQLSEDEHKRIILLSVFGPLFDDLFDDHLLDHQQITALVATPETYVPVNATDHLVKELYLELLRLSPRPQPFKQQLQEVSYWEKASLKQLNPGITGEELYRITYDKSYHAILLYCAMLDHYPSAAILEILYPVAGLMQLTNDAFDVWKDVHKDVYTLPNLYRNFEQLQQQFKAEIAVINHKLWQLPYPAGAKRSFSVTVHSLHAMGWMSLEQLKEATKEVSSIAALKALSRKELVCDLDSLLQQWKWLKYVRQSCNYFDIAATKDKNYHVLQPAVSGSPVST